MGKFIYDKKGGNMELNVSTDLFGDEIKIVERELENKLGQFDPATGEIAIHKNQSGFGKLIILIHEAMHACETSLIECKVIKEHINHEFISACSFFLASILAVTNSLRDFEKEHVTDFLQEQEDLKQNHMGTSWINQKTKKEILKF